MVANPARGQLNRKNIFSLSPFAFVNLVSLFVFSSYTCNRRSHPWDYVEPGEAFCYFS